MKILTAFILLSACLAIVMAGCSDNSDLLVPSTEKKADAAAGTTPGKGSAALSSVTGNANIWIEGRMGVLTISARLYEGGIVKGLFNLESTAYNPKAHMHGKVVALKFYDNYSFSNGLSGPTALFWWQEELYDDVKGKFFASFVVDRGVDKNGIVHDWAGPGTAPYDAVADLSPQDIADGYPEYFVPTDVGNVTIH